LEEEAVIVRDIFDLYINQNKTLGEISSMLTAQKIVPSYD
jgi:hypothetical protein